MPLEEVPAEIGEALREVEQEAAQAVATPSAEITVDAPNAGHANAVAPKRRGRPPKEKCPGCHSPLAKGRECPTCKAATAPRPAWEPLPIDDLRERLRMLAEAGVESYEDGAIKITLNHEARLARKDDRTPATRW